jgi:hypothetical protein
MLSYLCVFLNVSWIVKANNVNLIFPVPSYYNQTDVVRLNNKAIGVFPWYFERNAFCKFARISTAITIADNVSQHNYGEPLPSM